MPKKKAKGKGKGKKGGKGGKKEDPAVVRVFWDDIGANSAQHPHLMR